jgi:hypothetical protein
MADKINKPTQAEIDEGLALLQKKRDRQERIKSGELKGSVPMSVLKELNPEMYEKRKKQAQRQTVSRQVLVQKAIAAGIKVTDAEIDAYLAKQASKA